MKTLIILMLATGVFGAPFVGHPSSSRNTCSKRNLRFPTGKELTYNYVGQTVSSVNGSSTALSALKITARCVIKTIGACQHVLKIYSVELWEGQSKNLPIEYRLSGETKAFARELYAHDLVFRSRNGAIVEVLSSYDETPQNLNIKKGILSALQVQFIKDNSLVNETDIAGNCPVQYRIHSKYLTGRTKVLSKTRNLKECKNSSKTYFGIHIHQYNEKSFNRLYSSSNCRYILDAKKRVMKVVCQEKHLFRPFSSGAPAGASTTIKQVLELQGTKKAPIEYGYDTNRLPRSTPLTFEHVKPNTKSLESGKLIKIIKQLARESIEETKPESARLFSHLIFHLRRLNSKAVERVWDGIFDCDKFEKCTPQEKDKFQMYLLDALPHCGTPGCALVMSRAIERQLVNGERGNMFLTGLALVSLPKEEMIEHVLRLCQVKSSRTCMLTLGTLIHKFCEDGKCNRLDVKAIVKAEEWLMGLLGKRCDFDNSEQAERVIMALKAIGNAGRPSSENSQFTLMKCAINQNLPTNMTLAALKAFRRMPCNEAIRRNIMGDFESRKTNLTLQVLISGISVGLDGCFAKDKENDLARKNASELLTFLKRLNAIKKMVIEEIKQKMEANYMPMFTKESQKRIKQWFDKIDDLPSPISELISLDPYLHKQSNWPLSDMNSSAVGLIDFVHKMAIAGNTDKNFTKSMLFLDVEAAIPTILGLPLKLEAKGTAVVSSVENKDPVVFFGPVTFNYLGNRKISAAVEIASRFGVDLIFAENRGIISRNTLYTPSQSGTMQVLNTGL